MNASSPSMAVAARSLTSPSPPSSRLLLDLGRASFAASAAAPPPPPPPPPVPKPVPMPKLKDSFLDGTSSTYIEELQERYRADAASVDASWAGFFRALEAGVPAEAVAEAYHAFEQGETHLPPLSAASLSSQTIHESMKLLLLVRGYQVNGHFMANLDPLGLDDRAASAPSELDPATYGFSEADLDREFYLGTWKMKGFLSEERPIRTLREVLARLREAYCGAIGYEFMHIPDRARCNWIRERVETAEPASYSAARKVRSFFFLIFFFFEFSVFSSVFIQKKYSFSLSFSFPLRFLPPTSPIYHAGSHPRPPRLVRDVRVLPRGQVLCRQEVWPRGLRDPGAGDEGLDRQGGREGRRVDRVRDAAPREAERAGQRGQEADGADL